jgi:hypothetical protein
MAHNTKYNKLIPGKEILIDVAKQDIISLTLDSKSADSNLVPKIELIKEWSGFECDYKQTLLLLAGFNPTLGLHTRTWEIQLTWKPGADLSGCIVKVSFPGMLDSRAELFMNY